MSLFLEWISRVVPPRAGAVNVAPVSNTSTQFILYDAIGQTGVFNVVGQGAQSGFVQCYGAALMRVQAEGQDIYVAFGPTGVTANSAATGTATGACSYIGAAQDREFEIDPLVDHHMALATKSGNPTGATARWWIVSWPKTGLNFGA